MRKAKKKIEFEKHKELVLHRYYELKRKRDYLYQEREKAQAKVNKIQKEIDKVDEAIDDNYDPAVFLPFG